MVVALMCSELKRMAVQSLPRTFPTNTLLDGLQFATKACVRMALGVTCNYVLNKPIRISGHNDHSTHM